ncbi:DUF429 domain-containing protein [Thermoleophilum album]|uniref:Predicted nuclease (RNAse H fold) n=1 Tax=Thermoleophilum album TaxID=29539 RepID=A0A1H6FKV5_THEAL|nr:DUF429 domain-containing protein [Thermoleophilum album]SEH10424.1 Predicted nuclease (RNAse H fold) [Thermoleophilum album]
MASVLATGVDGAPGGWVAAAASADSPSRTELVTASSFAELATWHRERAAAAAAPLALDLPVGLPERAELRVADRVARARLRAAGASAASVFPPPARWMLAYAHDYAALRRAVAARRRAGSREPGLSAQAAALIAKVREVDESVRTLQATGAQPWRWLWECHPELSFLLLAARQGMAGPLPAKATAAGALLRLRLVRAEFPDAEERIVGLTERGRRAPRRPAAHRSGKSARPAPKPALADCLDAYAALFTALRITRGEQETLGGACDACGVPMRIAV